MFKYYNCQDQIGECSGGCLSYLDILFAQGGIAEERQEIGNQFDKWGWVLYKSSCVWLASEQGLWDVGSLAWTVYQELLFFPRFFGRKRMAYIRECWRGFLSVQKGYELCSKTKAREVVCFWSSCLKSLPAVRWDENWPRYAQWLNKDEIGVVSRRISSIWQSTEQPSWISENEAGHDCIFSVNSS